MPNPRLLERHVTDELPFTEYSDPDGSGEVVVTHTYEYEPDTQIKRIKTFQHVPGRPEPLAGSLDMRMYFPQELDALLHYNGFEIIHKWGDRKKSPFGSDSTQQIVVTTSRAD